MGVSAAELFKGQRQHNKNNEFKSPYQNLQKTEPLLWQIWCPYGHSSNQDTVHEQAESLTSYDTRQLHLYTCVCPYKRMGLRNHMHTHACWMLLHARYSLRHQDSSNIRKSWPKTQQCHMPKQLNPQRHFHENCHHTIINDVCSSLVSVQACCRKLTVCLANKATNNCINNGQQSNRNGFINAINIYYENNTHCPWTLSNVPLLQKTCTTVPVALWRSMNQELSQTVRVLRFS
jgi:hypothetical protein